MGNISLRRTNDLFFPLSSWKYSKVSSKSGMELSQPQREGSGREGKVEKSWEEIWQLKREKRKRGENKSKRRREGEYNTTSRRLSFAPKEAQASRIKASGTDMLNSTIQRTYIHFLPSRICYSYINKQWLDSIFVITLPFSAFLIFHPVK